MAPTTLQAAAQSDSHAGHPWQVAAEQAGRGVPGLDWLAERRATALVRLDAGGLPDSKDEDWRYTSLAGYLQRWTNYLKAAGRVRPPAIQPEPAAPGLTPDAIAVEIVDGELQALSGSAPSGLTVASLRDTTPALRVRAEALVGQTDARPADSLVDLNTALLRDVVLIGTEAGACPAGPVHVGLRGGPAPSFSQPRLLVDLGPGSRLTLILEHTGADGALVNAVTQIRLGRDSQLDLVRVQAMADDGMLTETTRLELGRSASLRVTSVDLGSQLSRQAITVLLAGAGSSASVEGLFLADAHRHIDNRTVLEHQGPLTTSRESFRGIADEHGHGVFSGKVIMQPAAAGSNAALTTRNLLLANTAEIDTKPELEIYVDDVRCSHGATTGQLDANALFYLRSRGLDPAAARRVLTAAFLRESLAGITIPALRSRLDKQLEARLGGES